MKDKIKGLSKPFVWIRKIMQKTHEWLVKMNKRHSIYNIAVSLGVYVVSLFLVNEKLFNYLNSQGWNSTQEHILVIGIGIVYTLVMYFTFKERKHNVPLSEIVLDILSKAKINDKAIVFPKRNKKETNVDWYDEVPGYSILYKYINEKLNKRKASHPNYNSEVSKYLCNKDTKVELEELVSGLDLMDYYTERVPGYMLYQYFSSLDKMNEFRKTLTHNGEQDDTYRKQLEQSVDLEKFYEGVIWTIGGIFITASFTILALSLKMGEIDPIVGFIIGTGIYFIFYKIFLRFRMSLRLFRNVSRIYESALNVASLKYVYDIELKSKYGNSPRIREILLSVLYIMINACAVVFVYYTL